MGDLEGVEVHPAAQLFPLIKGPEFDALVADIAENGQRDPIVMTPDGKLLDGRNRWRACAKAGVTPVTRVEASEPWAYVISTNLHRRHLNEAQRAMVGARVATRPPGQRAKTPAGVFDQLPAIPEVAELLNVGTSSINRARRVARDAIPDLQRLAESGEVPMATAARVAEGDEEAQRDFVAKIKAGLRPRQVAPPAPIHGTNRRARLAEREEVPAPPPRRAGSRAADQYVNTTVLRKALDAFEALEIVLRGTDGLDPSITNEEAARWLGEFSKTAGSHRRITSLLRERKESAR